MNHGNVRRYAVAWHERSGGLPLHLQATAATRDAGAVTDQEPKLHPAMQTNDDGSIVLTRDELYKLVWTTPVVRLAKEFGLSDSGLAKACERLKVPRPGRGYWARRQHGRPARRVPLPKAEDVPPAITITPEPRNEVERPSKPDEPAVIEVPEALTDPHRLVARTADSLRAAKPGKGATRRASGEADTHGKPWVEASPVAPGDGSVLRNKVDCLRICEQGPIAVVYPEGTWYADLNIEKLDRIINEHLVNGNPVEEYVFAVGSLQS
jgi:(2Fe-2S) ferredoxin